MKDKQITGYRLSKDLNIPNSTLRNWLSGRAEYPRGDTLQKLAEYLHVHPVWLLYGDMQYAPTLKDEVMRIAERMQEYKPATVRKIAMIVDALDDRKQIKRKAG